MFKKLFKQRYCRIFSKRFLGITFWMVRTPIKLSFDQYILVSGKDFIPNKTLNAKNACISSQAVACHLRSGFVWMHCSAWWLVSSTIFSNRSSGQRRRKKSKAVPSSGICEVGPVCLTNSSTWTGELSIVQYRYPLRFHSHWCSCFCSQKLKYQIHHLIAFLFFSFEA